MLAEEEAALPSKPQIRPAKGAEKTALKREQKVAQASKESAPVETLSARNIDDALDLLSLVDGSDAPTKGGAPYSVVAAATGGASGMLDRHPERRFKAALAAYEERELPIVRKEVRLVLLEGYQADGRTPVSAYNKPNSSSLKSFKRVQRIR